MADEPPDFVERRRTFNMLMAAPETDEGFTTDDIETGNLGPGSSLRSLPEFGSLHEAHDHLLSGNERRPAIWAPPAPQVDSSIIPTMFDQQYHQIFRALTSINVTLGYHPRWFPNHVRRHIEARVWLLYAALNVLHTDGCRLMPQDFNFLPDGVSEKDKMLGFSDRWEAVITLLLRFRDLAERVAWGSGEDILDELVAAPLSILNSRLG